MMELLSLKRVRTILIGPKISGILDILSHTQEPIRFEKLRLKSRIKYKKSYIRHLKFCVDKKLVVHWKETVKHKAGCNESWFLITDEGRYLVSLLS